MSDSAPSFLEQSHALDSYFEALLGGAPSPPPAPCPPEGRDTPVPAWAAPSFEAMLFRVRGLKLAMPTLKLVRVEAYPEALAPADGGHPWVVGRFAGAYGEATLIDLARIVIPARYRAGAPDAAPGPRIILFGGGGWAFACDQDVEIVTLEAHAIRWATRHTSRPWLAGTVMGHSCGLLNVEALIDQADAG